MGLQASVQIWRKAVLTRNGGEKKKKTSLMCNICVRQWKKKMQNLFFLVRISGIQLPLSFLFYCMIAKEKTCLFVRASIIFFASPFDSALSHYVARTKPLLDLKSRKKSCQNRPEKCDLNFLQRRNARSASEKSLCAKTTQKGAELAQIDSNCADLAQIDSKCADLAPIQRKKRGWTATNRVGRMTEKAQKSAQRVTKKEAVLVAYDRLLESLKNGEIRSPRRCWKTITATQVRMCLVAQGQKIPLRTVQRILGESRTKRFVRRNPTSTVSTVDYDEMEKSQNDSKNSQQFNRSKNIQGW